MSAEVIQKSIAASFEEQHLGLLARNAGLDPLDVTEALGNSPFGPRTFISIEASHESPEKQVIHHITKDYGARAAPTNPEVVVADYFTLTRSGGVIEAEIGQKWQAAGGISGKTIHVEKPRQVTNEKTLGILLGRVGKAVAALDLVARTMQEG